MSDLIRHYRQLVGIAKTWAEKTLPGWCDDTHRDLLHRHGAMEMGGRMSASTLNLTQLGAVLEDYERRGWVRVRQFGGNHPGPAGHPSKEGNRQVRSVPPRIAHIVRLWGRLGMAGKVTKATRHALLAWCGRQVGRDVPDLDSLDPAECQRVIEALKGWMGR